MKCWICGDKATKAKDLFYSDDYLPISQSTSYTQRCYCEKCFAEIVKKNREDMREYVRLRKKIMFNRAVDNLERQKTDLYEYKEAIQAVEEYVADNPDKFDSSYEMIAAIVLIYNRIECKPQYRIGKYQVDFLLPLEQIVLEIDGEHHRSRKNYDARRDAFIRAKLGNDWKILRIGTYLLDQKAVKLVDAIHKMSDYWAFGYV